MQKKDLIILSDFGLDDACAFVYLSGSFSLFNKVFVVCVAGNVSAKTSLTNAKRLVSNLKNPSQVTVVDASEIMQSYHQLPKVHGGDGMGDLHEIINSQISHISYLDFVSQLSSESIILSLGPLTVTLDLLKKITPHKLVIMAGVVDEEPNFDGVEFNQALDRQAFCECVKLPHVIATLDTCRAKEFNLAGVHLASNGLLSKLVNRSVQLAEARHKGKAYIYDLIAALYITVPEIFKQQSVVDSCGNKINQLILNKDFDFAFHLKKKEEELG